MIICAGCADEIPEYSAPWETVQDHDFIYHVECWQFFVERFDLTEIGGL